MTWANMSRMLEATDNVVSTQQINRIARDLENFNEVTILLSVTSKDE